MHKNTSKIETERLILRRFSLQDAQDMVDHWAADPLVQKEYGEPVYESIAEAEKLIGRWMGQYEDSNLYRWAVILKDSDACIGQIAFCFVSSEDKTAEVEYCIGRKYWGNGYAPEALAAVIEYTFLNTDFLKLEAFFRNENAKSEKVLIKAGMKKAPNIKRFELEGKRPDGKTCYAISKREFMF